MNIETFWTRVAKGNDHECWLWTGKRMRSGGRFGVGGDGRYNDRPAHRVAYEITVGEIPDGLQLDHLCGVPRCVNPAHLEPVTAQENTRRHFAKQTTCKNEELLTEIRRLRMGNHPAGRALIQRTGDAALAEALTERDAEHEGGGGA